MGAPLIGASVLRREDHRFLTGNGQYTDDISQSHQTYAAFVRSPHAHATIKKINTAKAMAAPGVVAVFTGDDTSAVGGLPCGWLITGTDGQPMKEPPHPVLARGKVRYVGDHVAIVIAESQAKARDAAELVDVEYDVLPAVVNGPDALKAGAPQLHEGVANNKCYNWALGDKAAVDKVFAGAAHVTKLDFVNNRLECSSLFLRASSTTLRRLISCVNSRFAAARASIRRCASSARLRGVMSETASRHPFCDPQREAANSA